VEHGVFQQIALVLAICVAAGGLAVVLRQPLLVGLLVAGVVVGPEVLGIVSGAEEIELLGEIGIALLLFVVGLKLDPRLIRRLGPVVMAAGTVQVLATTAVAYAIARAFGTTTVPALYLAVAMAFSSTVIVIKLLTDRRELEQLHGRIALGILIVQDIVVVVLMIVLSSVDPTADAPVAGQLLAIAGRAVLLLGGVAVLSRSVLPRVTHVLARQGELLVLASVAWAVALAAVAVAMGFSAEVGAFLAGAALASSGYREAISGRLATLRDFLLVFFFIDLGTDLQLGGGDEIGLILALALFVLVGKPLIIAIITTLLGFRARVGVRAGLTLAQISEFSLILVALGVDLGQVGGQVVGEVTAIALVTITVATYLSSRAETLAPRLAVPLLRLERTRLRREFDPRVHPFPTVVVVGLGRLGQTVVEELREQGDEVLAVDYDPRNVSSPDTDATVIYGDAEDPELPSQVPLHRVRWVASTLRDLDANRALAVAFHRHGYDGRIAVACNHPQDEHLLREVGVDLVIRPLHVAAGPFVALMHAEDGGPHGLAGPIDDDEEAAG
jgi:Kef-type K+ transport system membrane component KefB